MIKRNFNWALLAGVFMLIGFTACEQEDRFVGAGVVGDGAAQLHKAYVDLMAVTLGPDSLRADRTVLQNAVIGVYDEPLFGKNKSYFYSQVRLGTLNPDFGNNSVVDSVILSIPVFAQSSDTVSREHRLLSTRYTLSNTDTECSITDTLSIYETRYLFEMDSLYGNRNSTMTLQVHRVTDNLQTIDSARYSNQDIQVGELFGSMTINSKAYKSSTAQFSALDADTDSTAITAETSPRIKMKLDGMKTFVQDNIVNQEGSTNLGDQISFINNVLQGVRIGVADENGFLLTINPANISITAYISSDNPTFTDTNGNGIHDEEEDCPVSVTKARTTQTLDLIVGSALSQQDGSKYYNVVQSRIYNDPGSISYNVENQPAYFVEGMGGSKVRISLNAGQIEAVRDSVRNHNWVISEAHFKIYPEMSYQNNLEIPQYLYLYNYSEGKLLPDYGSADTFATSSPQAFPYIQISRPYDPEKGYYVLRVTEFIKNIIEDNAPVDDLALEMGNYLGFSSTELFYAPRNAWFSNRAFNPFRLAIVGTHPSAANETKKLRLEIYYNRQSN